MGLRSRLCAVVVVMALALVACTSPGKPFAYKDVKVSAGPGASPSQPVIGQDTTISFTLRNTWSQTLGGSETVEWELWETGASPVMVSSGSEEIAAFSSTTKTHVITGGPTKGTHTYEVRVDPNNDIAEEDETNNTSATLTVLVADQEITFGTPAPAVALGSPASTSPSTLTFTISNTVNAAQIAPTAPVNVPFDITLNGAPITPSYVATPASPATVNGNGTLSVSVDLPPTNSAGSFVYTITLSPADGDDRNTGNNTSSVTVVIPAGG